MTDICELDTNVGSLSRLRGATASAKRSEAQANQASGYRQLEYAREVVGVLPAPYVLNGPADQLPFHESLLKLQVVPAGTPSIPLNIYGRRLSLVAEVDGTPTWQSMLECPGVAASSWNSNYGSHGWHRYVGRFPSHLVRALLNHFQATKHDVVLDPFAGSGTTGVECRLLGIPSIGIEISPLSALIARTKSSFPSDSAIILRLAGTLDEFYMAHWSAFMGSISGRVFTHDEVLQRPGNHIRAFPNYEKWLTPAALLGVSIVAELASKIDPWLQDLLLLALSAKMRSIGNVDVDVVRAEYRDKPRINVDVLKLTLAQLRKMAISVDAMYRTHPDIGGSSCTQIMEGNVLEASLDRGSITHVITSPPYGIESLSYLRTHLLSFRCLEYFLRTDPYESGAGVIGSEYLDSRATAPSSQVSYSHTFTTFFEDAARIDAPKLLQRAKLMMVYFQDIGALIERLRVWVRPHGLVAFVVGNKRLGEQVIPANQIICELFSAHGFEFQQSLEHKLKTNNSNSQVPWQERIIQDEHILIFSRH